MNKEKEIVDYSTESIIRPSVQRILTDVFQKTVQFKENSGLKNRIVRVSSGKCCERCTKIAGEYIVGIDDIDNAHGTGVSVFFRHNNCDCLVTYHSEKGIQNVHNREWYSDEEYNDKLRQFSTPIIKTEKNTLKYGKIIIDGDAIVPCLLDNKTGELVDTIVSEVVNRKELKGYNKKTGWFINWSTIPKEASIFKLCIKGDDTIQGLIAITPSPNHKAVYLNWAVSAPHNNPVILAGKKKRYEGVGGHLFAIAAEQSLKHGFGGAMYGYASNKQLLAYYCSNFGGVHLPIEHPYEVFYDERAAADLLRRYNYEWKN